MKTLTNKHYLSTIILSGFLLALASFCYLISEGISEELIRVIIRRTAQLAVLFFSLAFSASSLHHFFPSSLARSVLYYRPVVGLLFATMHFGHLIALASLQMLFHPVFELADSFSLFAGTMGYVWILVMVITTFYPLRSSLKPRTWKLLHLIGGWWIYGIFFNSYLKNVVNKDQYHFYFALLVLVLILRVSRFTSARKR